MKINPLSLFTRKARVFAVYIVLGFLLSGGGYLLYHLKVVHQNLGSSAISVSKSESISSTINATNSQQVTGGTPAVTTQSGKKIYAGNGVQFSVNTKDVRGNDLPMTIEGNKITVGTLDGVEYYAQIFTKTPSDSLDIAIKKQFLNGYSSTECKIRVATNLTPEGYPSTFQKAEIYPVTNPTVCPPTYETFDTGRYFLMDVNHPDTYVFVQTNQTPIDPPVNGKNWEQTISFN